MYRLFSLFGFVAHLGDAIVSPFRLARPRGKLVAGTARIPGSAIVAVLLGVVAVASFTGATYADANKTPTTYTVAQVFSGADRAGKDYATIKGQLWGAYVDETQNDTYAYTYYLLGDLTNTEWILVRTKLPEAQMAPLVADDGTVTLTGMLSTDSAKVSSMIRTLGSKAPTAVDPSIVFDQGDTPLQAGSLYAVTAIAAPIAALLLICWLLTLALGYVFFRPSGPRQSLVSGPGSGFLLVRVTGLISGYSNGRRARELRAQLRVLQTDPPTSAAPIDLVWQTLRSGPAGVRLTPGVTSEVMGTAYPVTGARPAIRARFGRFDLVLSFDSEPARDAAFDQLRVSAGLIASPDGASASSPGAGPLPG